jgi:FixJ family two-component response regulator
MESVNRFDAFNPMEREVLRLLIEGHLNAISEIAMNIEVRVSEYTVVLERLEREANGSIR